MPRFAIILLTLMWLSHSPSALATAQVPDAIELNGVVYPLLNEPLDSVLEQREWTPPADAVESSANWRGYVAHWTIRNDILWLLDVTIEAQQPNGELDTRSIIRELFDDTPPIPASWYDGTLIVPDGKLVSSFHAGYESSYDHYQVLVVEGGRIRERRSMDRPAFEAFQQATKAARLEEAIQAERARAQRRKQD